MVRVFGGVAQRYLLVCTPKRMGRGRDGLVWLVFMAVAVSCMLLHLRSMQRPRKPYETHDERPMSCSSVSCTCRLTARASRSLLSFNRRSSSCRSGVLLLGDVLGHCPEI